MNHSKFLVFLFIASLFMASCGKDDSSDDTADPNLPTACLLNYTSLELDETTRLGLFDVAYDNNAQITSAGLQTYDFSYDTEGNVVQALLEESSFNPQVRFIFTYENGKISQIQELWGVDTNLEERHVFTPVYDGNFVDKMMRTGLGGDVELDYDFDSNGNALIWTDPTFTDYAEFTFDTDNKGLVEGLTHNQAFAYGIAIAQPFFHFNNTVTSRKQYDSDGTLDETSTFTDITYNQLDFQTKAGSTDGNTYYFEYECE